MTNTSSTASEQLKQQSYTEERTETTSSEPTYFQTNEPSKEYEGFWIRGNDEKGYIITMGNRQMCEPQHTAEQCEAIIRSRDWNLILNFVIHTFTTIGNVTEPNS